MRQGPDLVFLAFLVAAGCGSPSSPRTPTAPATSGYSVQVNARQAGQFPSAGLVSPLSVDLDVRDGSGNAVPVLDGTVALRDTTDTVFARASGPGSPSGRLSVSLAWSSGEAQGKAMDVHLRLVDAAGGTITLDQSVPFPR